MTDYKKILIERSKHLHVPFEPEKPLDHIQQANKKNLRAWRERFFIHKTRPTWLPR